LDELESILAGRSWHFQKFDFHRSIANQTPTCDSHGLNEDLIGGSARLEFLNQGHEELFEAIERFALKNNAVVVRARILKRSAEQFQNGAVRLD
jgi:hypothetical protein